MLMYMPGHMTRTKFTYSSELASEIDEPMSCSAELLAWLCNLFASFGRDLNCALAGGI